MTLRDQLMRDEGLRLMPYTDPVGRLTIGYGRNLTDTGIRFSEAEFMLANDMQSAETALASALPWTARLDDVRRAVFVNMLFNLGPGGLLSFRRMLAAAKAGYYARAAIEMLNSTWAEQVGDRAVRLALQMRTGEWA